MKSLKIFLIVLLAVLFASIGFKVYSQSCEKQEIELTVYKKGIYVVSIDKGYFAYNSDVYVPENLESVQSAAVKNGAKVAINAGFFDPNNGKTISYVIKQGEIIENPQENERLIQSEELKPYLDKILNRSEFRLMHCRSFWTPGFVKYDISKRNALALNNCSIISAIQAGPELFPNFDLEEEFFILKKEGKVVRESASVLQKVARSAIAIKDDRILLIAASNKNPMTLKELSDFIKSLGVEKAMAFDGGSSTSLYVDLKKQKLIINSAKDSAARRVKSVLIVK